VHAEYYSRVSLTDGAATFAKRPSVEFRESASSVFPCPLRHNSVNVIAHVDIRPKQMPCLGRITTRINPGESIFVAKTSEWQRLTQAKRLILGGVQASGEEA
jgi:hypothetical protein